MSRSMQWMTAAAAVAYALVLGNWMLSFGQQSPSKSAASAPTTGTTTVRVRRPHLSLFGVTARLFAFDVHRKTRALQAYDRGVDRFDRIDNDSEVRGTAGIRV